MARIDALSPDRLFGGRAAPRSPSRSAITLPPCCASLRFALPRPVEATVAVLDPAGAVVRSLIDGKLDGGEHACAWDGRDDSGRPVPSGTYVLRLVVETRVLTSRRVVIG